MSYEAYIIKVRYNISANKFNFQYQFPGLSSGTFEYVDKPSIYWSAHCLGHKEPGFNVLMRK